ncbi:cysteine desulfurase [Candidatus Saccharibacteria bacterium]|jgi:cysteine desulfurase|nr:cysteine desulfurase [Candidatus Saccharibacteria bacterium]
MTKALCYLDYAAATPLDERVFSAMKPYLTDYFFNPSSPYDPAIQVKREYRAAKEKIAHTIGATADELVMTAGATESINLAIGSFGGHKICSEIEHDSVKKAIQTSESYTLAPVDKTGRVDIGKLEAEINDETQLISVALANHEIGTIQPLSDVAALIKKHRELRQQKGNNTQLVLHCDASQGFGLVDIHVARLGVDLLTLNAAKIYGPKQVGLLWVRPGIKLTARIVGGGQELGLRSGTENVAGVVGFSEAVRLADKHRKREVERLGGLRDDLQRRLTEAFPGAIVSGNLRHRLANYLHISFPNIDAERLVFMLESSGVLVATGSACAANKATASAVLRSIGLSEDVANGSLRLTLGRQTTEDDIQRAADAIIAAVQQEAKRTKVAL